MRNTKIIGRTDVLYFPCDESPFECSYSQEYFAAHSEHVTLQQSGYSNGTTYGQLYPYDADSLHPWERDLVTNGEPFARPSNRVQS